MTTPVHVPAGTGTPAPSGQVGDYTHAAWMGDMAELFGDDIVPIYRALCVMEQTQDAVQAGRTQLAHVRDWQQTGLELLRFVAAFAKNTDERFIPVFEAIQTAGGQAEVAQDKQYHQ